MYGWLEGLCGSLAVYTARYDAKHIVVMSGSGYENKMSQRVLNDLCNEGCHVSFAIGDAADMDDVRSALWKPAVPIGGIIQGAMVLRVSRCWTVRVFVDTDML